MKKVVIVGAGFGGLSLAKNLASAPVEVLLIDKHNYHTFQPLLYQVATAGLEAEEIAHATRGIFQRQKNFRFCLGEVVDVNWGERKIHMKDASIIDYDYLVLAAGGTTNYFGVDGAEEYGFALKSLEEAIDLRSHIIMCFEKADQHGYDSASGLMHIVVVGGGPTGVEMAGALCELIQKVLLKDYPDLPSDRYQVTLVEASPGLLNAYNSSLQTYAVKQLKKRGVNVLLNTQVTRVTPNQVYLNNGDVLDAQTLVWAAGIQANTLATELELPTTRGGRIEVDEWLRIPGYENVFAVGDIAASKDQEGTMYPQLAPVAMQAGKHVATVIKRELAGKSSDVFEYKDRGTMATIGRNAAVAELNFGFRSTGFIAWIMWLVLHLMQLVGFRNRLNVLLNWAWNYFTYDRSARLIMPVNKSETLQDTHSIPEEEEYSVITK
ncbi:MAG: NAD(P)/FAD-dependent oxidoreductase [Rhodothermaceae bacterium]|nr:NAD(P)/FAD-dependent oxidoreductase [Rhodothermaceae bacterium]